MLFPHALMAASDLSIAAVLVGRSGAGATPGDLVMIQGLLLQLWAPLQFLGWLYRCDMGCTGVIMGQTTHVYTTRTCALDFSFYVHMDQGAQELHD